MSQLDEAIRAALSAEDAKALERYQSDLPLPQHLLETARGQQAWMFVLGGVFVVAFTAAIFYCGWRFLITDDTLEALRWGAGFGFASLAAAMLKLWFFMEMQKTSVIREVKRLELQVARLSAR